MAQAAAAAGLSLNLWHRLSSLVDLGKSLGTFTYLSTAKLLFSNVMAGTCTCSSHTRIAWCPLCVCVNTVYLSICQNDIWSMSTEQYVCSRVQLVFEGLKKKQFYLLAEPEWVFRQQPHCVIVGCYVFFMQQSYPSEHGLRMPDTYARWLMNINDLYKMINLIVHGDCIRFCNH